MTIDAAVIAGTGVGEVLEALPGQAIHQPTPYGMFKARLVEFGSKSVLLIRRHSSGHKVPPHLVNYRAFAWGARALGVPAVFATAAVGSLRKEWAVGTIVVTDDFWEATYRNITMYDDEVNHVDFTIPFRLKDKLIDAAAHLGIAVQPSGVYVGGNGPRFETAAEIRDLSQSGDLVGMTASTEAIVFGEMGIPFGLICVVTNPATGLALKPHEHGDVTLQMKAKGDEVVRILERAVEML